MVEENGSRKIPVLIYANKKDLEGAMSKDQIIEYLSLTGVENWKWFVQPSEAVNGEGLYVGADWLTENFEIR